MLSRNSQRSQSRSPNPLAKASTVTGATYAWRAFAGSPRPGLEGGTARSGRSV
jgi:hypothetical protein